MFINSGAAFATDYYCKAQIKYDVNIIYSQAEIDKGQFATVLEEIPDGIYLSRCSYSVSVDKVTCDRYKVDKIVLDDVVGIKKYYVFKSQFDFQIFPNLSSVENNGRGSVQYGQCEVID